MTESPRLLPRKPVPALRLPVAGGGIYELNTDPPSAFSLLVFYRGLHCPICKAQLKDLDAKLDAFIRRGVSVVAISADTEDRAVQTSLDWGLSQLRLVYDLPLSAAREWGLYVSRGRGATSAGIVEPDVFTEPAIFLVRPDGTLYFGSVQTMPFARPSFADIIGAIDFVVKYNYPARGEVDLTFEPLGAK
ncbi:alkyl hydroperoxide reductase [Ensifer sp. LC54]|nr:MULTISPECIES: peroxiredoxin-like family protein [unclassified Ensifer]OCP19370.1 alkyl hydroperoxide reductase [Ensifer sp. LC54]OCP19504.1 alkyl hydroperoxide reductase [Ensifer sp. LC384]